MRIFGTDDWPTGPGMPVVVSLGKGASQVCGTALTEGTGCDSSSPSGGTQIALMPPRSGGKVVRTLNPSTSPPSPGGHAAETMVANTDHKCPR